MSQITSLPPRTESPTKKSACAAERIQIARIDASHRNESRVVVDLSRVERIDTRELGELIRLHLDVKREDRVLVLENLHDCVLQVMQLTRLDRLFRIEQHHPA